MPEPRAGVRYKPVLHHLIDVAATALTLQLGNPRRLLRVAEVFNVKKENLARTSAFLAGLHDLGKFSVSFQAKVEELWPETALGPYPGPVSDRGHWRNTAMILRWGEAQGELAALFPRLWSGLEVISGSVAGHHGRPPNETEYNCNRHLIELDGELTRPCLDAAVEAMRHLRVLVCPEPLPELSEPEQAHRLSWWLAGLTTLSDWVGSDAGFFRFEDPAMPLDDYWRLACERADDAVAGKRLVALPARVGIGYGEVAGGVAPRPMQIMADSIPIGEGPQLFIIEDTTGSGKTEAALTLAGRLMEAGKAGGIYFALPTMATANAMYSRLAAIRRSLFAEGTQPSLVLAHGHAELVGDLLARSMGEGNGGAEDNANSCAEWIADNRRKAFFADIGAGTIDQAFLSVLRKKHLTLRQYALADRVLIVDEAHAFDAYMGKELETLLEVQAAQGGSAIILSATLPADRRQAMVDGFRRGLGQRQQGEIASIHYPLMTFVGSNGIEEHIVDFCDELRRTVGIERLADPRTADERALVAARKGAAVLVIRNAVDEAIASFKALRAEHDDTMLFHARFAMCDRQAIEADVMSRFGRYGKSERRAGHILVATQVVEQSLDLDFDLVISDLAPVDLLIQRAGRLWRHMDRRPTGLRPVAGPKLCVVSPDPRRVEREDWLKPALGAGASVYKHAGIMWRTAKVLFEAGAVRTPEDLRPFIERVYGEEDAPDCLHAAQDAAVGSGYGERFQAGQNLIEFCKGYPAMGNPSADQEIGTRLGEKMRTLRLARLSGGKLVPWLRDPIDEAQSRIEAYSGADAHAWASSEISVRAGWLGAVAVPGEFTSAIRAAKAAWPEWERDTIQIAVVDENGAIRLDSEGRALRYSPETGLTRGPVGE